MIGPDSIPEGAPYLIGVRLVSALREADGLAGVAVLDNPVRASDLTDGARVVFYEDVSDRGISAPGGEQKRAFAFNLGVINRTGDARRGAHLDYRAAKRVVRDTLKAMRDVLQVISHLREGDVVYRLENIDVGGSLILAGFTIEYREPS